MIDMMKRLAELDAPNPRVMSEMPVLNKSKGIKESQIEECGVMPEMGMPMDRPSTPATINMTAGSAAELGDLLKDIVSLAGMDKGDSMGTLSVSTPAPTALEPAGDDMGPPEPASPTDTMRSVIDKLNPDDDDRDDNSDDEVSKDQGDVDNDGDHDMKDHDKEKVDEFDNEPNPEVAGMSAAVPSGNDMHKEKKQFPAAQPGDNAMAATFEGLMAEYQRFINEEQSEDEGPEQLSELSKGTVASYREKKGQRIMRDVMRSMTGDPTVNQPSDKEREMNKKNLDRAHDRLSGAKPTTPRKPFGAGAGDWVPRPGK